MSTSGSSDTPNPRWKVRLARRKSGDLYSLSRAWNVFEPNDYWSGTFDTWDEAMAWATTFSSRVEHWLEHQP